MNKKISKLIWITTILVTIVILYFFYFITIDEKCNLEKISFNLNGIDENGLRGQPDGKVSIDYEFCVPYEDTYLQEIKRIDSTINCYHGSSGRIGCTDDEYLCIGNTGYKDFRSILCKLSSLNYIERIDETFWE